MQESQNGENRPDIARRFKYLAQFNNPRIERPLDEDRISCKTFRKAHKKAFDKLEFIFSKYNIDSDDFLEYSVNSTKALAPETLLSASVFMDYARRKEIRAQYEAIYSRFAKSVDNIAHICVERNIAPREFIRELIVGNKLAYEYISGRISKYFIASMQNFREIYNHLDQLNRDELRIICSAADELNGVLQDAALYKTGGRVRPIESVETRIRELKIENKSKTTNT